MYNKHLLSIYLLRENLRVEMIFIIFGIFLEHKFGFKKM